MRRCSVRHRSFVESVKPVDIEGSWCRLGKERPLRACPEIRAEIEVTGSIPTGKFCVLVLGMHRSGTSALTRTLNLLGAALPKDLLNADANNETGYWESRALNQLHEEMLYEAGSRWDDWRAFDQAALPAERWQYFADRIAQLVLEGLRQERFLVLKDPRICRFVPLYQGIMKNLGVELRYVLPVRNPLSVAASLAKRDRFTERFSAIVWLRHVIEAERTTRGRRRVVVSYEEMIEDWRPSLERIADLCGNRQAVEERASAIEAYLSGDFDHHRARFDDLSERKKVSAWVKDVYGAMLELKSDPANTEAIRVLDDIKAELDRFDDDIGDVIFAEMSTRSRHSEGELLRSNREVAQLKVTFARAEAEARQLQADLARTEAEARQRQADLARTEAEARQLQADLVRTEAEARQRQADLSQQRDEWRSAATRSREDLNRLETILQASSLAKLGIALSVYRRLGHRAIARRVAGIITREGPVSLFVRVRNFIAAEIAGDRK